jgi:hypothetical protein
MRLRTSTSSLASDGHFHYYEVSPQGDGMTTHDSNHTHNISNFNLLPEDGHDHCLMGTRNLNQSVKSMFPSGIEMNKDNGDNNMSIFASVYGNAVTEKATNTYGQMPAPRQGTGVEHRRALAISKVLKGQDVNEKSTNTQGQMPYQRQGTGVEHRRALAIGKVLKGQNVNEKATNTYGQMPYQRQGTGVEHRRLLALKSITLVSEKSKIKKPLTENVIEKAKKLIKKNPK